MNSELLAVQHKNFLNLRKDISLERTEEIQKEFVLNYTFDAVSMEGTNKIPLEEIKRLQNTKELPEFCERDQKEALNHFAAFELVVKWVNEGVELDEERTKDLHEILVKGIFQGGMYRNVNVQIPGATHQPPDYIKVYDRMKKHYTRVTEFKGTDLEKAVYAHASIAKIHPFFDGNGRLARLVLNYYLLKANYLPVSIPRKLRSQYIESLETFKVEKDIKPLVLFFEKLLIDEYERITEELDK